VNEKTKKLYVPKFNGIDEESRKKLEEIFNNSDLFPLLYHKDKYKIGYPNFRAIGKKLGISDNTTSTYFYGEYKREEKRGAHRKWGSTEQGKKKKKELWKEWYPKNKEKRIIYNEKYKEEHTDEIKKRIADYRKRPEVQRRTKEYGKKYREEHKEQIQISGKDWARRNAEKRKKISEKYEQSEKGKVTRRNYNRSAKGRVRTQNYLKKRNLGEYKE